MFKMEITKDKLVKFLEHKNDVTLSLIFKELNLTPEDLPKLEVYMEELVKEGIIEKVFCEEHKMYEYDYIHRGDRI